MLILILNAIIAVGYASFHIGNRTWEYKGELKEEVPKLTSADCPEGKIAVNGKCVKGQEVEIRWKLGKEEWKREEERRRKIWSQLSPPPPKIPHSRSSVETSGTKTL